MSRCYMIREPEIETCHHGFRRWVVAWGLFNPDTQDSFTRTKRFFTHRGAARWLASKTIKATP